MTDADLLTMIRNTPALRAFADAGHDAALSDAINAALPKPTPISVGSLMQAAPQTLAGVAGGTNPLSEMEVIASRIRAGDAAGIGTWAGTLALLGKMPSAEHTAVDALVRAALTADIVNHIQVSCVLNAVRPRGHVDGAGILVTDPEGPARTLPIAW